MATGAGTAAHGAMCGSPSHMVAAAGLGSAGGTFTATGVERKLKPRTATDEEFAKFMLQVRDVAEANGMYEQHHAEVPISWDGMRLDEANASLRFW